eukprot:c10978_g1_i1 orf=100-1224(+)
MSDNCSSGEKGWHSLSPDLQERILLLLPVSTAVKLAAVCKSWRAIFAAPSFSAQLALLPSGKLPWFFLWGINELIHTRSAAFAFDPMVGRWFRLQITRPPNFNRVSLSGNCGVFWGFSGSKVCFTPTPTKLKWKETSPAIFSRCYALMGTIGNPLSQSFKFVAFGGILDDVDERVVEIYNSHSNTWESSDPFLEEAFLDSSSHWMSSATLGNKFYVARYDGNIASFDVESKLWSKVQRLNVPDLVSLFIIAGNAELFAICQCRCQKGECLKLFKVNDGTMGCIEVSMMPQECFKLFENEDEQKGSSMKCVGSGGLLYVYSEQYYKGYPVCMCDLTEESYTWKQLPSLPSPPRFDRVVCCSASISPRDCLENSDL